MSRRNLYRCWRCGGFYHPATLYIEPGHVYPVCSDTRRCSRAFLRSAVTVRVLEP